MFGPIAAAVAQLSEQILLTIGRPALQQRTIIAQKAVFALHRSLVPETFSKGCIVEVASAACAEVSKIAVGS